MNLITAKTGRNRAQKLFPAVRCEECGAAGRLERHHVNEDPTDNRPENVMVLCMPCHYAKHEPLRCADCGRFVSGETARNTYEPDNYFGP